MSVLGRLSPTPARGRAVPLRHTRPPLGCVSWLQSAASQGRAWPGQGAELGFLAGWKSALLAASSLTRSSLVSSRAALLRGSSITHARKCPLELSQMA